MLVQFSVVNPYIGLSIELYVKPMKYLDYCYPTVD